MGSKFMSPEKNKARGSEISQADKNLIAESGFFDEAFYTEQVGSISNNIAPIEHFLIHGASNLASPSRAFDSAAYVEKYKDVQEKAINPLLHYLKYGVHEGRQKTSVSVQEDSEGQLRNEASSLKKDEEIALISKSSFFDEEFYVDAYADQLEEHPGTPNEHYLEVGIRENLKPSLYFDPAYYLKAYPDVKKSGQPPLLHYIKFGEKEGRQSNSSVSEIPRSVLKKWAETAGGSFPYIKLLTKFKIAEREKRWSDAENHLREILELESESAIIYSQLAATLRHQGKWWQEVEALKSAIELEGQHATWHYRLGEAQEVMSRFRQAAAAYGKAIELKKSKVDAEWYYRQGYCYAREGHDGHSNSNRAKQAYQQAIDKDTKFDSKRFGIGVFHQKRGHWVQAAEAYAKQLLVTPLDAELNYRLGMAYDRCYEWEKAERYYTLALGLEIDKPDWHYRLGFVRERQKKYVEASEAYQYAALTRNRHTPYWFYRWGYVLEQAGEHQQACDAFLQTRKQPTLDAETVAIPQEPLSIGDDEQETELNTVSVSPSPLEQYKQVLLTEHQVAQLNSQLAEDCTSPVLWFRLGNVYERQQQWQQAADAYQHALARQNDHTPEWYFRLGYVLTRLQKYTEACEAFFNTRILRTPHGVTEKPFNESTKTKLLATYAEYYEQLSLKGKKILFESFNGSSISCNPYAIFLHMYEKEDYSEWLYIWVVNDLEKIPSHFKNKLNIVFVEKGSDLYLRYICEAQYLINNSGFPPYFIKKKGQKYLATWHGTPLKTLGKEQKYKFFDHKRTQRNFLHATHIISPNDHTTNILFDSYDIRRMFSGKLAETGYPRIDLTLKNTMSEKDMLKERLGLIEGKPVVLYAPTWRGTLQDVKFDTIQLEKDIKEISKRNCSVIFRGHSLLENSLNEVDISCKNVPEDVDTNELLSIVDVLITDYSSIFFDFIPLNKPIIYYTYDLEEYEYERGLYFQPNEMPGKQCKSIENVTEELDKKLGLEGDGLQGFEKAFKKFNRLDDGGASERVLDFFLNENEDYVVDPGVDKGIENFLIYPGGMEPNGITTSFINLVKSVDRKKLNPIIAFSPHSIELDEAKLQQFNRLEYSLDFLPRYGNVVMTLEERYLRLRSNKNNNTGVSKEESDVLDNMHSREFKRIAGLSEIKNVIHFSGYDPFWAWMLASLKNVKKSIYLHNDLYSEYLARFPYLSCNFSLYDKYEKLVSVSQQTSDLNRENISKKYNVAASKFVYCDNLQDPEYIKVMAEQPMDDLDRELFVSGNIVFLTMGRLSVEKDHIKLIKSFSEILSYCSNAKLFILGNGPMQHILEELISELSLENSVYLLGRRFNPFPFLKKSDCFVLSSNHEGQPMVLFEAMILGKPVISTDIVGSRSVLDGRPGLLVENSIAGLSDGMCKFIDGRLKFETFKPEPYQESAINMFYKNVCEMSINS